MIYRPPEQAARQRGGTADREVVAGLLAMAFLAAGLTWFTSDLWCPKAPRLCLPDHGAAAATPAATAATPAPAGGGLVPSGPGLMPGPATATPDPFALPTSPTAIDLAPTSVFDLLPTALPSNPGGSPNGLNPFGGPSGRNPFGATPSFPVGGGAADPLIEPSPVFAMPTETPWLSDEPTDEVITPSSFVTVTPAAYPGGDKSSLRPTRTPTTTSTPPGFGVPGGYPAPAWDG